MSSLTNLMASLPPASLAETDLARFIAQALGRRTRAELPGLAAAFGEEALRGYAPSLGPILQALTQTVVQQGLDPQSLDARTIDGLLGSGQFLGRLEARVAVSRQRLRPGTVIAAPLRQTLGMRLLVLPGVGRELVLIAPVDLAQVPDARFAVPLGVVLARNAPPEEAEVLRASWAMIEERFGLDGEEAAEWGSRFVAISRLENHDAQAAAEGLAGLEVERRTQLWEMLVSHLRDGELPEQHRSGRRGLERKLGELGLVSGGGVPLWVEATMSLAESVYRGAGLDPEVMAGRCPAPREDVERWAGWVDVPAAGRERVKKLSSEAIEMALVRLAEEEAGRAERSVETMSEPLARALASLRDGCLRPRWQRSRWALAGIDPLYLARWRVESGEDTTAIRKRLEALAQEAVAVERAQPKPVAKTRPHARTGPPPLPSGGDADAGLGVGDGERDGVEERHEARLASEDVGSGAGGLEARAPGGPDEATTVVPRMSDDATANASAPTSDGRGLRPSRFNLPPLPPVPPPRPAPRVRARTDFPPMPTPPPPRTGSQSARPPSTVGTTDTQTRPAFAEPTHAAAPRASDNLTPAVVRPRAEPRAAVARPASQRIPAVRPTSTSLGLPPPERHRPTSTQVVDPPSAARLARPRTGATVPHLVTPTQGNDFYDASFRELELIERDLVQRGPYAGALERVQAITTEADELHAALGPSARSGDREFQAAQKRIEKVQAYLERIRPLLAQGSGVGALGRGASGPTTRPGLLGRLFGKRDPR